MSVGKVKKQFIECEMIVYQRKVDNKVNTETGKEELVES